jgi:microcystin-dependent protein
MDVYMGTISAFAFNYAPVGWLLCDGRELNVRDYQALYSLLGNMYGGTEGSTFKLPDLRGRTPVGKRQTNPGLSGGSETVALTPAQVPAHSHRLMASMLPSDAADLQGKSLAVSEGNFTEYTTPVSLVSMAAGSVADGGSAGHENMQPTLTVNYCINYSGNFPPHN